MLDEKHGTLDAEHHCYRFHTHKERINGPINRFNMCSRVDWAPWWRGLSQYSPQASAWSHSTASRPLHGVTAQSLGLCMASQQSPGLCMELQHSLQASARRHSTVSRPLHGVTAQPPRLYMESQHGLHASRWSHRRKKIFIQVTYICYNNMSILIVN